MSLPDWQTVGKKFKEELPNILAVVNLILSIPPSSAEAERGFSQLKLVKSNLRSNLDQKTLNNLLAVKMLASVETYNPAKAIEHWNNSGARSKRPNFLESTNSTTAKSVSNLQIVKAPISDSNENHIDNVESEDVIALSDSEYSDTDCLSESEDFVFNELLNDSSGDLE